MKKLCFILFSFLFLISCEKNSKPNIFWIVVEDQSQYLFPFYSNEDINLHNLKKLSEDFFPLIAFNKNGEAFLLYDAPTDNKISITHPVSRKKEEISIKDFSLNFSQFL